MKFLLTLMFASILACTGQAADKETRVFEMRTYYAAPGKLDALLARFREHTLKIFENHGMVNIGYWVPVDNTDNKLVYVLAYPSREAAGKSWREFGADPEWKAVQKETEANGRLVTKVESVYMTPTDYSPLVTPSISKEPRLWELRTYTATAGKLDNLNARFRDHTLALFAKHGMSNFGYWTPLDKKDGAGDKLVYLISHKDKAASDASWAGFRADADWNKAKAASEVNGSLTIEGGVKSEFLKPTDFSPAK